MQKLQKITLPIEHLYKRLARHPTTTLVLIVSVASKCNTKSCFSFVKEGRPLSVQGSLLIYLVFSVLFHNSLEILAQLRVRK